MNEERTGVIWYLDPHGILIPLIENRPPWYGKLNPHGILTPLISNEEIGRGSIYHG
jgi:hypothetical protein